MPNEFGITYDKAGFCALCHDQVADFDGFLPNMVPRIVKLRPNFCDYWFAMNDGSQMKVTLCIRCRDTMTPEKVQDLMESIIRGWQWEVDNLLPTWTKEQRKAHMTEYSKKFIINRPIKPWTDDEVKKIGKPRKQFMKLGSV